MYRRDRVGSGSTVSSVVSSFSQKSREASKDNVPSRLPRGPTTKLKDSFSSKSRDKETVTSTASFSFKSRDHTNQNGSTGSRSDASSVSSRRESRTSSVSSYEPDMEPVSPAVSQSEPTIVGTIQDIALMGKVSSPKVIKIVNLLCPGMGFYMLCRLTHM